jgi:hypothetical protein
MHSWYNVSTDNSTGTITLDSDLNIYNNFLPGGNANNIIVNGDIFSKRVLVNGNMSVGNGITTGTGGGIEGTALIILQSFATPGTWAGTWSAGGTTAIVQNNMTAYSVNGGNFISGTVYYEEGKLTLNP